MEATAHIETKPYIEYRINDSGSNILMKPDIISDNYSITATVSDCTFNNTDSESITNPSESFFIVSKIKELIKIYTELGFSNEGSLTTSFHIIQMCSLNKLNDIVISKTGHDEILIYRKKNGVFLNLLIDDEGDVAFVKIGPKIEDKKIEIITDEKVLNEITSYLQF